MGAYAPAPVPYTADELVATFVQPILDHFAAAGTPYVGVLYAGLMLTAAGPRLVEYNVRFGDPEAQALLPLLDCDLAADRPRRHAADASPTPTSPSDPGAACTVVAAAAGYPSEPRTGDTVVAADRRALDGALLFPAGLRDGRTSGGRVLAVTGVGDDLAAARAQAYAAIEQVAFAGMQYRRDIGWRAPGATLAVLRRRRRRHRRGQPRRRHDARRRRADPRRRGRPRRRQLRRRLLGQGDRGDGRPRARRLHRRRRHQGRARRPARPVRGLGHDIVNHCVGDVFVQSARPLFFLDYIAASRLDADLVADIVSGMAEACAAAGCTLLGGETAEMPGVYTEGSFDIAGTLVGVAERDACSPATTSPPATC